MYGWFTCSLIWLSNNWLLKMVKEGKKRGEKFHIARCWFDLIIIQVVWLDARVLWVWIPMIDCRLAKGAQMEEKFGIAHCCFDMIIIKVWKIDQLFWYDDKKISRVDFFSYSANTPSKYLTFILIYLSKKHLFLFSSWHCCRYCTLLFWSDQINVWKKDMEC